MKVRFLCVGIVLSFCFSVTTAATVTLGVIAVADAPDVETVDTTLQNATYCYSRGGGVDGEDLYLDVYAPKVARLSGGGGACVIYVFGGGFIEGSRDKADNVEFYRSLTERGYTVVAIDYRLGLKGKGRVSPLNPKPAFNAVRMATEDLLAATAFVIENREIIRIDTSQIVVIGSSAGAITALEADYWMANRERFEGNSDRDTSRSAATERDRDGGAGVGVGAGQGMFMGSRISYKGVPEGYRYAGVVSMAGAVFSVHGKPSYGAGGAVPTLFFHGTADKVVNYTQTRIGNIGMFGTNSLVDVFKANSMAYCAVRYVGSKHEVAEFPRVTSLDAICDFMDAAMGRRYDNQVDITISDREVQSRFRSNLTLKELYNGH